MTYIVRVTHPGLTDPSPREFNLDNWWDWEAFSKLMESCINPAGVTHLYEGEAIVIECLERDDSSPSKERRAGYV